MGWMVRLVALVLATLVGGGAVLGAATSPASAQVIGGVEAPEDASDDDGGDPAPDDDDGRVDNDDKQNVFEWVVTALENIGRVIGDVFDGPDDGTGGATETGDNGNTGDNGDAGGDTGSVGDGTGPITGPPGGGDDTPEVDCAALYAQLDLALAQLEAAETPEEENLARGRLWLTALGLESADCPPRRLSGRPSAPGQA